MNDDLAGPDERDRDLLDGSWEERYYSGRIRQRDWRAVSLGISLLVIAGLVVSGFAFLLR